MALTSKDFKAPRIITANNGHKYILQPLLSSDLDDFYKLHSDPRVWQHLPSARHTKIERTSVDLQKLVAEWHTGASYWSVRDSNGNLAGVGGIRSYLNGRCWNVYYRISPEFQGLSLATKLATEAVALAKAVNPELAVVSYMLANNPSSRKVAERIGFTKQWEGYDSGNPDPDAIRLIYSDRPLRQDVLDSLIDS